MSNIKPRRRPTLFGVETPTWLCTTRRYFADLLPKVYGPRGMVMLGQALMCACFGTSYLGILGHKPQPALEMVTKLFPLQVWAVIWFIVAFMLVASAFKVDQSRALGVVAAMLSLWSLCFLEYFLRVPILPDGTRSTAFVSTALLAALALSAAGSARMMNHAPSHPETVLKPGEQNE
jgi:hypothetical protein